MSTSDLVHRQPLKILQDIQSRVKLTDSSKKLEEGQRCIAQLCNEILEVEIPPDELKTFIEGLKNATSIPHAGGMVTEEFPSINMSLMAAAKQLEKRQ